MGDKKRGRPWEPIKGIYVANCPVFRFAGNEITKGCCEVLRGVPAYRQHCGICGGMR